VKSQQSEIIPALGLSPTMSGHPHRNFAVKKFPGTGAVCAAIWRPKIYWNKSHGCSSLQSSAQAFGEVGLGEAIGPQRTGQAAPR